MYEITSFHFVMQYAKINEKKICKRKVLSGGKGMFLFNCEEVYVGFSLEELANVRECLSMEKIKYKYRVVNINARSGNRTFGSYGTNKNLDRQYYVSVQKKDSERAKYLVNKILHKS